MTVLEAPEKLLTDEADRQHLLTHLEELRTRILVAAAAIVVGVALGFWLSQPMMAWLVDHSGQPGLKLVQLAPGETLMAALKLAVLSGLAVSSPVWLYQLIRFVLPGLTSREKTALWAVTLGGTVLFGFGVAFAAKFMLPTALEFLLGFASPIVQNQIAVSPFLDFCLGLLLLNGLLFELPLVVWGLAGVGLITSTQIMQRWREAIVVIAVLSAVLTPSQDPASMLLVAGMLLLLIAVSLVPLRLLGR